MLGKARQALFHQGAHVVQPAHLFRQKNHGRRCPLGFQGLHLNGHLVVGEGRFDQITQSV